MLFCVYTFFWILKLSFALNITLPSNTFQMLVWIMDLLENQRQYHSKYTAKSPSSFPFFHVYASIASLQESYWLFFPLNCYFQLNMSYLDPYESHKIHTLQLNLSSVKRSEILKANIRYWRQIRLSSWSSFLKNSIEENKKC